MTAHNLRHSFMSRVPTLDESHAIIGGLLGHSEVQTTARYAHPAGNSVKEPAVRIAESIAPDAHMGYAGQAAFRRAIRAQGSGIATKPYIPTDLRSVLKFEHFELFREPNYLYLGDFPPRTCDERGMAAFSTPKKRLTLLAYRPIPATSSYSRLSDTCP